MKMNMNMRTIKFRGKKSQGDWVYGFFTYCERSPWIGEQMGDGQLRFTPVDETTIGQSTNLADEGNLTVFEGDIVRCCSKESLYFTEDGLYWAYVIRWDTRISGWNAFPIHHPEMTGEEFDEAVQQLGGTITWPNHSVIENMNHYRIIGNVTDNKDYIKDYKEYRES